MFLLVIRCGSNSSTKDLLDATFFRYPAIELVAPVNDALSGQAPEFVWSHDMQGATYRIEIAEDADFKKIVLSKVQSAKQYTASAADLTGITALDATEYYWRVSAASGTAISASRRIQVILPGVVYVDGSSTRTAQYGNKANPIKTIGDGIAAADARRATKTTAMEVRVSKDNPNAYTEDVLMRPAISILGGYDAAQGWSRSIENNNTTIKAKSDIAIAFGSANGAATIDSTVVEGFIIAVKNSSLGSLVAIDAENAFGVVRSNVVLVQGTSFAKGFSDSRGGLKISGNIVQVEGASLAYGIHVQSPNSTSVTNNVVFTTGAANNAGIELQTVGVGDSIVSNNTIVSAAQATTSRCIEANIQNSAYYGRITNNLLMPWVGTTLYGFSEAVNNTNPGTFENNAILNASTAGTFYTYGNNNPALNYADLTFQSPTQVFNSGPDKGRNNLQPTAGANTIPFVSFPSALDYTNATSASATTFRVASGAAYSDGNFVELSSDSIPRKISCAGACGTTISFSPAFDENTVPSARSVRLWGSNATAQACYNDAAKRGKVCRMLNLRLVQAAGATAQDWADLRYGGKNTSQSVCGAAAGGTGAAGPGVQSCGNVTTDAAGMTRTAVVSQATTNGAGAAGFSIGAYEAD